ncbi:transporter substrate-binding domain-containing protein [Azospirillum formosense]|uniref:Transporter substrate-binding domain-containing protein n=1 Tax=Azospirillum formosense TaxID=861533 RepID=A0ABX2KMF1_9PROT|nr:transporter substrate-binding domain-containing protein [Azospirillum formosense]NUB17786.1 transporter substrate-binding domain-containing protein [Azospirillum formosense]
MRTAVRVCLAGVARLLVVALVLASAPARAENWTVASEDYFPPYNFTERGKRTGMDTEIVDAMLKDIGVYPVHRPMAWPEVVRAHDENEVDVAFQFFTSPRRLERGHLIGPYRVGATVLMVRSNSEITYARIDDLQGLRIGVVDGFEYTPEFDKSPLFERVRSSSNVVSFRRLLLGRVDAIAGDLQVLRYLADSEGRTGSVKILPTPLAMVPRYISVPKMRADKAERLQAAYEKLKRDGTIDAIVRRWER